MEPTKKECFTYVSQTVYAPRLIEERYLRQKIHVTKKHPSLLFLSIDDKDLKFYVIDNLIELCSSALNVCQNKLVRLFLSRILVSAQQGATLVKAPPYSKMLDKAKQAGYGENQGTQTEGEAQYG